MSQQTIWSSALGGLNGSLAMVMVMSTMLVTAQPMQGQDPTRIVQPDSQQQAPDTTAPRRTAPLFSAKDAVIAAGFGVATIVLFQSDRHVAIQFQDEVTQANYFLRNFTGPAENLAYPGGLIIEGGLYAVGRLAHKQRMAEVGWHSAEAIMVATAATNILKKVIGRARPYVSGDPHDFQFFGGLKVNHDRSSFPSGHATTAFAFAAAVASESRTKWPDKWWSEWLIPVGAYGGATIVGVSRLYKNQHWASDVVLGAAIGTFSGIKVIQYAHTYPNNRFDRFMLGTRVVPLAHGGLLLAWSSPAS